jgi:hypothetical protein
MAASTTSKQTNPNRFMAHVLISTGEIAGKIVPTLTGERKNWLPPTADIAF